MGVYDASGNQLYAVYDAEGTPLTHAYDADGSVIFTAQPTVIKAMSFNVGCFYTQYFPCPNDKTEAFYNRHRTIFNTWKPDLCGMQEWNNTIGTIQSSVLMDEFFDDTESSYVYPVQTAALTMGSKYELTDFQLVQYVNQSSGDSRYYQKAYVNIDGKRICFVNTHLGTSSIRNAQFLELLSALENEDYFVCFGDFNFRIEEAGDSEYNLSIQLALNKGFNSAQNADEILLTGYHGETVATSTSSVALDNIITSSNIDISDVAIDTLKFTDGLCVANEIIIDHVPIVATLTIN